METVCVSKKKDGGVFRMVGVLAGGGSVGGLTLFPAET